MSFVKAVCSAMERIAPLRLAEPWDNVGLLLEAPVPRPGNAILLTNDLTPPVVQEALSSDTSVIVSYHPTIFRPLSSLTLSNPLQASLLRCAQAGISIYCPHTALDSVKGGINDWLAKAFGPSDIRYITDKKDDAGGVGRKVTLPEPGISIHEAVVNIKKHLSLQHVQLAVPFVQDAHKRKIRTIAVCAGSGASVFQGVDADLYFTGEMQHHEVLAAIASNKVVVLCGHTNTERGYLPELAAKLRGVIAEDSADLNDVYVSVSMADQHPLVIV